MPQGTFAGAGHRRNKEDAGGARGLSEISAIGFRCAPDPDNPGWARWESEDPSIYNSAVIGPLLLRQEGPAQGRVRLMPRPHHLNPRGAIHGGIIAGFFDVSMFAVLAHLKGVPAELSSTVDLTVQYIGPGQGDRPLDAVIDLLRETGRMAFVRGLGVQGGTVVASFSGTIRKASTRT